MVKVALRLVGDAEHPVEPGERANSAPAKEAVDARLLRPTQRDGVVEDRDLPAWSALPPERAPVVPEQVGDQDQVVRLQRVRPVDVRVLEKAQGIAAKARREAVEQRAFLRVLLQHRAAGRVEPPVIALRHLPADWLIVLAGA